MVIAKDALVLSGRALTKEATLANAPTCINTVLLVNAWDKYDQVDQLFTTAEQQFPTLVILGLMKLQLPLWRRVETNQKLKNYAGYCQRNEAFGW